MISSTIQYAREVQILSILVWYTPKCCQHFEPIFYSNFRWCDPDTRPDNSRTCDTYRTEHVEQLQIRIGSLNDIIVTVILIRTPVLVC